MLLETEIRILNNDIYMMKKTKNYLVVNNNYIGIDLYDNNLKYVKTVKLDQDVSFYSIFSSILNNNIIMFDYDNYSNWYLINLDSNPVKIIKKNIQDTFGNSSDEAFYYPNNYKIINEKMFILKNSKFFYVISYDDGIIIEKRKNDDKTVCLALCNDAGIFIENNEVIYKNKSFSKKLQNCYTGDEIYELYNDKIIRYNENNIFLYNLNGEILFKDFVNLEKEFSIRQVCIYSDEIFVLTGSKTISTNSNIKKFIINNNSSDNKFIGK